MMVNDDWPTIQLIMAKARFMANGLMVHGWMAATIIPEIRRNLRLHETSCGMIVVSKS